MTPQAFGEAPAMADKRHAPATLRNRDAIAAVLASELPPSGLVLEVASGSGEHAVRFAQAFPALEWQPSDADPDALASIAAWREQAGLPNVRAPMMLDAAAEGWSITRADALLCVNMVHISPWNATVGLFRGGAQMLPSGAPLILYGPYVEEGVATAPSNIAFNLSLRERNPEWGGRRKEDVDAVAAAFGFERTQRVGMVAHNLTLVYRTRA